MSAIFKGAKHSAFTKFPNESEQTVFWYKNITRNFQVLFSGVEIVDCIFVSVMTVCYITLSTQHCALYGKRNETLQHCHQN